MKIFVSADIEGVTGATHWDETDLPKTDYAAFREQMTAEVVAACEGALQAGATEIWVKDAHDTARNIIAAKLPQEVRLIRGWGFDPFMMVQGLDDTFQAAMMIGYHSRAAGGTSPLAHTMTGNFAHILLNDRYASEFLIHTYAAAYVHVPVVLVSGDKGLCDEVTQFNPYITTVAVKEGIGGSTVNIHPNLATARIRDGVVQALSGDLSRLQNPLPARFTIEVCYHDHTKAYPLGFYPGAKRVDPHTIRFEADSYFDILRFMLFTP
jgi:D-amino peptidase